MIALSRDDEEDVVAGRRLARRKTEVEGYDGRG